jgi:DNA-binding SARP family transcriptional activator
LQPRSPLESIPHFENAVTGFREAGDVDGEVAAITAQGLVLWWANDVLRLFTLHQRVVELAAGGSTTARLIDQIARAAIAHLGGDSPGVLAALADFDGAAVPGWLPLVTWLRSVAHRRTGDLELALAVLDHGAESGTLMSPNREMARLRALWLLGDVEESCAGLLPLRDDFERTGDQFNVVGTLLEVAARRAWLGQPQPAGLDEIPAITPEELQSPMVVTVRVLANAAIAIDDGDEAGAAEYLRTHAAPLIGRPDAWYVWDRGATTLVHVLVPETRPAWDTEQLPEPHRTGLKLARVLESARDGDLAPAASMQWPAPGIVRSQLPMRWVVELIATGLAAGNPAPDDLVAALGSQTRPALKRLIETGSAASVAAAAAAMAAALPALPDARLSINVLGPLEIWHDDHRFEDPDIRRQRVRELLSFLVVRGRARREEVAEELWPDHDSSGRNLRVTLNYLQHVLQPGRDMNDPPYFVRSNGPWLSLEGADRLDVDAWKLVALLDDAEAAEKAGRPAAALAAYVEALPLWRGEPYADVPYPAWAEPERARLRLRYNAAAVRAGELQLASGARADARGSAQRAIDADPTAEPAYQLLARTHLAENDVAAARRAIDACVRALAELNVSPQPATFALVANAT